jgi:anti-sigma regulatory factor (Ser/Thr protein kinase)
MSTVDKPHEPGSVAASGGSTAGAGPVTLVLPPIPSMVRVGRLTASSVASLADMTIDDIDDIKIAVSEMITLLIQSGSRAAITLRFETTDIAFSVEASTPTGVNDLGRNDLAMATAVLDAVADEHQIVSTDDRILMRIVKHLDPTNG